MNRYAKQFALLVAPLALVACTNTPSFTQGNASLGIGGGRTAAATRTFDSGANIELDAYVQSAMLAADVPGATVAVIQNGQVVFEKAYGVKRRGALDAVNLETQFLTASVGKSMTTMLMASIVDAGRTTWDTPARQLLPNFAVADPVVSSRVTLRNLVCNCTGAPRQDFELIYNGDTLTAAGVLSSVRDNVLDAQFGTRFSYSNQFVAIGGYAASVAGGASSSALEAGYAGQLQQRVLTPIGMTNTTTSFPAAQARSNLATPHGLNIAYTPVPTPLQVEGFLRPIAPAGGHWSTVRDMARFVQTQLKEGIAPNGRRIASSANLRLTWTPQVKVAEGVDYGLGLFISSFAGQQVISHGGNSLGFTAQIAFVPSQRLGIVVLCNAQNSLFNGAVTRRILEIGLDQPRDGNAAFLASLAQTKQAYTNVASNLTPVTPAAVTPFLGTFSSPALGEIRVSLETGRLQLDAGEFRSELKAYVVNGVTYYVMIEPPLAGTGVVALLRDAANQPYVYLTMGSGYTFTRNTALTSSRAQAQGVQADAFAGQVGADELARRLLPLAAESYAVITP
jgi:CubicO group peptidase (beta-lactamase class C family)